MSLLQYLQLQPIDPQDDGAVSDLDDFPQDEVIDLTEEDDGDTLAQSWEEIDETLHSMSVTDDDSTS
jgi:hypothetical protein